MNASDPVDRLLAQLTNIRPSAGGWTARCPAHDDRHNSLKIDRGKDGQALIHCHAGCEFESVLAALGMSRADLFPARDETVSQNGHGSRIDARHDYRDEDGQLLFQVVRFHPKEFRQCKPDGRGGWVWKLGDVRRVLYRLPELLAADPESWVLVVEGEKDADRLRSLGCEATTSVGGAGKWRRDYAESLRGRRVVVLPDNDQPGEQHVLAVAQSLHGVATDVRILRLPGLPPKGDVSDWLDAGGTSDELQRLITAAPAWQPRQDSGSEGRGQSTATEPAPELPIDILPPALRRYVVEAAASLNCPPEMIAVPMLGFAGALIGNRLHIQLKHSYREYPTTYIAVVAPPGSAKTPALNFAQWPLDALQNDAERRYRHEKTRYEEALDAWRDTREADRGPKPAKPRMRDYFSTNLTLEALVGMLDHAPGVAIIRDEILGWVQSMDQYRSKGSDRQEFLSLWSCKTIKVDRKGAEPIYRRFPVACVVGGIQPDMVAGLHTEHQERDGFVERLLPIVPDCKPMPWNEETVDAARYADVADLFRALDALPDASDPDDDAGGGVGVPVGLGREARAAWAAWFNDNTAHVAGASGILAGYYSKLPAHVARFALILHALWNPDDPRALIPAARMADAIELGEFFRAHIHRFLALLQATPPAQFAGTKTRILRILRKSEADNEDGWVNRSAILDGLRNIPAGELSAALDALLTDEAIERRTVSTATKPIEQWRLKKGIEPPEYSEYSEYSPVTGKYSEYSEYPNGVKEDFPTEQFEEIVL